MGVRGYRVPPLSRAEIRRVALAIRELLGIQEARLDMVRLVEHLLTKAGITYEVLLEDEMGGDEARAWPDDLLLQIREDVYERLNDDDPRSRFTIPHELGHLILHQEVSLARAGRDSAKVHKPFEDSEWQADTFSAEFSMPVPIIQGSCSSIADIEWTFGVSQRAAEIRYITLKKEGLI